MMLCGPFTPEKTPYCPLNRRVAGPKRGYEPLGEEINLFLLLGFKPRIVQSVAQII
jgi:hypothetical protein